MTTTRTRLLPEERRAAILQAAYQVVRDQGELTHRRVADRATVSIGLVRHYFGIDELTDWVMKEAIAQAAPDIIAYGLRVRNAVALGAPMGLRALAMARLGGDL